MKKPWTTPTVTERDMTPDDYQNMNDILIAQASENEIYIQGLLERIRDLEAQLAAAKARHEQPERDYSWGSHP